MELPELPEPAREAEPACAAWRDASPDYYAADQMQAYGLACARAALEAAAELVAANAEVCNSTMMSTVLQSNADAIRTLMEPTK